MLDRRENTSCSVSKKNPFPRSCFEEGTLVVASQKLQQHEEYNDRLPFSRYARLFYRKYVLVERYSTKEQTCKAFIDFFILFMN